MTERTATSRRTLRLAPPAVLPLALLAAGCGGHGKPRPSTTPARLGAPAAPAPPSSRRANGTFTGADVPTQFGDVQVQIVMKAGRITDLGALRLPFDRPRSQFISRQAAPILRSEVLAAQSAHIDVLTGATYTSDAWATSVQSALDQAR